MPEEKGLESENMSTEKTPEQGLSIVPEKKSSLEIKPIAGGSGEDETRKESALSKEIKKLFELGDNGEALIKDPRLCSLARMALDPRQQTQSRLEGLLKKGDDLVFLPENPAPVEEWALLASAISEYMERAKESDPVREEFLGMSQENFLDIVFNMSDVNFRSAPTGEISRQPWFKEASNERKDLYRAMASLSKAAEEKTERGTKIDLLFPSIKEIGDIGKRSEIMKLSKKEFGMLYKEPGVSWLLTEYAKTVIFHRPIVPPSFSERLDKDNIQDYTLQGYKDESTFKEIREEMRRRLKEGVSDPESEKRRRNSLKDRTLTGEEAKIAESIAYLLLFNSHLTESADTGQAILCDPAVIDKARLNNDPSVDLKTGNITFPEGIKIPSPGMINSKAGSREFRSLFSPLSRAIEELSEPGKAQKGWGAYEDWMRTMITKSKTEEVGKKLREILPERLTGSFFEVVEIKRNSKDEIGIPLIEFILKGEDIPTEKLSENPFAGYYFKIIPIKNIYTVFSSGVEKPKASTIGDVGVEIGAKVNELLQGAGRADFSDPKNKELVKKLILAMYHDPNSSNAKLALGWDPFTWGAFSAGLKKSLSFKPF